MLGEVRQLRDQGVSADQIVSRLGNGSDRKVKWVTLGNASFANMVRSALRAVRLVEEFRDAMDIDFVQKIRCIDLHPRQLTLGFEPSEARDLSELAAGVERLAAGSQPVALPRLISYFAGLPFLWEPGRTAYLLARLVADHRLRLVFGEGCLDRKDALEHLSRPAIWDRLDILPAEILDASELKIAKKLCVALFRRPVSLEQQAVADGLRRGLNGWAARLSTLRHQAATGHYPGLGEIDDCQKIARTLLAADDPLGLIRRALEKEAALTVAGDAMQRLVYFYRHQVSDWESLLSAVSEFSVLRDELGEDGARALDRLLEIQRAFRPYDMVSEISDLTARVKLAYRNLVAAHKARAEKRLDEMVGKLGSVLEDRSANADARNAALYPIRKARQQMAWAAGIKEIQSLLLAAEDHFLESLENR